MVDEKEYKRDWYLRHRGEQLEQARLRNAERVKLLHELIDTEKNRPCMDCGHSFPPECMDFDHVRGEKKFNVSHAFKLRLNLEIVREEMAKCDIVCSNCHRIRTKQRMAP